MKFLFDTIDQELAILTDDVIGSGDGVNGNGDDTDLGFIDVVGLDLRDLTRLVKEDINRTFGDFWEFIKATIEADLHTEIWMRMLWFKDDMIDTIIF